MSEQQAAGRLRSPLDAPAFPTQLTARVADATGERVRGYALEHDLALHYGWVELLVLTLGGELPSPEQAAAAEVALIFGARLSGGAAPCHASVLSRICGTEVAGMFGVASTVVGAGLAEALAERAALWEWLAGSRDGAPPAICLSEDPVERSSLEQLRAALAVRNATNIAPPVGWERLSALLLVLYDSGLRDANAVLVALAVSRIPLAMAEGLAARGRAFGSYPTNLPRFVYEEPDHG